MTPEQLLDRLEIDDLLTRYATGVDRKDWDLWESCFTADAVIDYTAFGGIRGGVGEVREWLEKTMVMFSMSQHMILNKEIEISGDSATSRAGFYNPMALPIDGGENRLLFFEGGYYLDQLVRTAEGWKIRERVEEFSYSSRLNPQLKPTKS
ncbi:MAG: nuclear transport factor 2 family protein [Deltaproteobacteria bacterium]|nr:nuclear transport factor 2 family protein [Deltaproteobacteria bacterium]MBW2395719.1 nuclear transport factor 2 family protein [Deltaproteobacteria bacterium]